MVENTPRKAINFTISRVFVVSISVLKLFVMVESTILALPTIRLKYTLFVCTVSVLMKKLQITGLTRFAIRPLIVEIDVAAIVWTSSFVALMFVAATIPLIVQVAERRLILPSSSIAFQGIVYAPYLFLGIDVVKAP